MYPHGWMPDWGSLSRPDFRGQSRETGHPGGLRHRRRAASNTTFKELGTAAQYGIHPIVLMFNDNAWGVLKKYQENRLEGRLMATDLVNPDFVKLFEAYGFQGTKVSSVAELSRALENAVSNGRTQLIEVQIPDGLRNIHLVLRTGESV